MASSVAKPQLRGLLNSQIKRNLIISVTSSIIAGIVFKYTVCEPRKQRYAEFYRNYDPEREFERMRKLGVFDSVGPD